MRTIDLIRLSTVTDVEHIDDWTTRLTYTNLNGQRVSTLVDNASLSRLDKYGYVITSVWHTNLEDLFNSHEMTNRAVRQAKITRVSHDHEGIFVQISGKWHQVNQLPHLI